MRFLPAIPLLIILCCLCLVHGSVAIAAPPQESINKLQTVAEKSKYRATSKFIEVVNFLDRCCTSEHVQRHDFGTSVEGRAMVSAVVANPAFDFDNPDDRLRILLLGNIHSGECAGKEALLAMLRELAADVDHPWLKDCVVVIAPNYNVDANERVGLYQRPGQVGPDLGMGQRENAMQLDLNRDFCKLESPEARSLVGLMDSFDPHMFIDCHTTNGSRHQYLLTYDIPHNPTAPKAIRDYLRNRMMPKVTSDLESNGIFAFYYGNFNRDKTQWATYGHEPRYSTEYAGLRGRLGILSEAYSYATYKERIAATDAFVKQCVEFAIANVGDVKELLASVRTDHLASANSDPARTLIHLQSEMSAFDGKFNIKAYDGQEKRDYEVTFVGDFSPTRSVSMPFAYVLPPDLSLHAERLQLHGIEVEKLTDPTVAIKARGTEYTVTSIRKNPRRFQKHNMVLLEASAEKKNISIDPGSFIVRTGQPLGRLVSYLLEPETNEGLVTWNFLDPWLAEGKAYPIVRIDEPMTLNTELVSEVEPGRMLRLKDIFGPEKMDLGQLSLSQVQWLEGGKSYSVEKNGRRLAIDAATGAESRLPVPFARGDVQSALREIDGPSGTDLSRILSNGIALRGSKQVLFVLEDAGKAWLYDSRVKKAMRLGTDDSPAELADLNHAGDAVAYVQDNNLKLRRDVSGSETVSLTTTGHDLLLNGKLDWVYQEELYGRGNFKAFWWSPNDQKIAWLQTDEAPVNLYTVTDHIPVRGRDEITAYPKAGDPLPKVKLGLLDVSSDEFKNTWVDLPELPGESLNELLVSRVTWDRKGEAVYVQVQDRIQSWLDLCKVDPDTGELRVLFRDSTPAWIATPGDPEFLYDGNFLWLSPRAGYNAIYLYSPGGTELARLTNAGTEVRELYGERNEWVYFLGVSQSPTEVKPMAVKLDGTGLKKLVNQPGSIAAKFNKNLTWFLAEHSTASTPEQIFLFDSEGRKIRDVIPNQGDQLRHVQLARYDFLEIPVGEEDSQSVIDAMLIKPVNYDPAKRYPVLVHVYGGPQTPRVRNRFGGQSWLWHQYMAQQGVMVFVVDNRSSSYRSVKDVWPIYRDLARRELADIEWAVAWLKQNYAVENERIGIWGWSYGGYMTAYAMTHSKTFNCGISGAPVTDWRNYDAIYTERYMSTPQDNSLGYQESSVLETARNLHGELLLIHGTIDDNVHISNTMQFMLALQKAGKQFELMIYPENRHSVREPSQRLHLHELMTDFLMKNLKPGEVE